MKRHLLRIIGIVCSCAMFGCETVTPVIGPDGTENQLISCGLVERCYDKAREVCRGPYKIVNTTSETSGTNGSTSTVVKLLVKCGR
jgi:hypothetical protein